MREGVRFHIVCLSFNHIRLSGILEFSHSQERETVMTHEEKVMFLMRLAVDTHNAYRSGQIASSRNPSITRDPISAIEDIYEKYEAFLDEKLTTGGGKGFFD